MRRLVITRGAPGSGKTRALGLLGLAGHALSMDQLRSAVTGSELTSDGRMILAQSHNDRVAYLFREMAEQRMSRGETLALDATFTSSGDFKPFLALARRFGYQVLVLDFANAPEALARAYNDVRPEHSQVPEPSMKRMFEALKNPFVLPEEVRVVPWDAQEQHLSVARAWLEVPLEDVSHWERLTFIGDLQSCIGPLTGPGGLLEHGFDPSTRYYFMGDFFDRGPDHAAVMAFLLDALALPNVSAVFGNHETHLRRWAGGEPQVSPEFSQATLPALKAAGYTSEHAQRLLDACHDAHTLVWRGQKILLTHAGLPTVKDLHLVSLDQLTHGTGHWEDPIDQQFDRLAPEGWVQVHGHRNHGTQPIQASARSFNLEGGVEHGGAMRAVTLDVNGWTPAEAVNDRVVPYRERVPRSARATAEWRPSWMNAPIDTRFPETDLATLRAHTGVREKSPVSAPHVTSFNFTRDVFFDASWDEVVVKARGLFVNRDTREVVARGYDKFFNVGERPETQIDALKANLAWPVTAFVKENGFLGNLGFDATTQRLFVASKSTSDGDFAAWFQEIFNATVPAHQQEKIRRFLRDFESSMVFEVIDPVRDPHMIDYDGPSLVLLDVFHRSATTRKLPYEDLVRVGQKLGLSVKERAMALPNAAALEGFLKRAGTDLSFRYRGRDVEGFVLEDAKGFQTKIKLPHYALWKRLRSLKDRLARLRDQKAELEVKAVAQPERTKQALFEVDRKIRLTLAKDPHPLFQAFGDWCQSQPRERLSLDVLALRQAFRQEVTEDPTWLTTPWLAFDPTNPDEEATVAVKAKTNGPRPS